MNPQLQAAWELHEFLSAHNLKYAVIGGIAVQKWGDPRFTQDVDITVAATSADQADVVRLVTDQFPSRTNDPVEFARRTRMVLIRATEGVDVDISLAVPGYEDQLFERAIDYEIEPGKHIRLCSAEDLIIHKAVASRAQDLSDLQAIVARQRERLDVNYVRLWLNAFAEALGDTEVLERFESAWREGSG